MKLHFRAVGCHFRYGPVKHIEKETRY